MSLCACRLYSYLSHVLMWSDPLAVLFLRPLGENQCWLMAGTANSRPWASYVELQSGPQLVVLSAGPGCAWEGLGWAPRPVPTITEPWGQVSTMPKAPRDLPSPVSCLLGAVTERATRGRRGARGRLSVSHQVGASGIYLNDRDSHSAPVLGLRPLGSSVGVRQFQPSLAVCVRNFVVGQV